MSDLFQWEKDIKDFIIKIKERIKKDSILKDCFSFKEENIDKLMITKNILASEIKSNMSDVTSRIDRHKLASAYVKAILTNPIFFFDGKKFKEKTGNNPNAYFLLLNEHIAWLTIKIVLESFSESLKNDIDSYYLKHPDSIVSYIDNTHISDYKNHFIKLIFTYRDKDKKFPLFELAHILFFIEMSNDCIFYDKYKMFYSIGEI